MVRTFLEIFEHTSYPYIYLFSSEIEENKEESLENFLYELVFKSRGDRIRTCDLVLPKQLLRKMRQPLLEIIEDIAY